MVNLMMTVKKNMPLALPTSFPFVDLFCVQQYDTVDEKVKTTKTVSFKIPKLVNESCKSSLNCKV